MGRGFIRWGGSSLGGEGVSNSSERRVFPLTLGGMFSETLRKRRIMMGMVQIRKAATIQLIILVA